MCDVDVPIHLHSNQMSVFAFFRFQRTNNDGGPNRFSIVLLGARTTVSFRLKSLLKFAFVMPCPLQALEKKHLSDRCQNFVFKYLHFEFRTG